MKTGKKALDVEYIPEIEYAASSRSEKTITSK